MQSLHVSTQFLFLKRYCHLCLKAFLSGSISWPLCFHLLSSPLPRNRLTFLLMEAKIKLSLLFSFTHHSYIIFFMSFPCFSYSEVHEYSNLSLKPSTKLCLLGIEDVAIVNESLQSSYRLVSPCAFDALPFLLIFFFLESFSLKQNPKSHFRKYKEAKRNKDHQHSIT